MRRRHFIKQASFLPLMHPMLAFLTKKTKIWSISNWESIVDLARWCPTVHNLQPHRIKVLSETAATLYYDSKRLLPIGDPDEKFTRVALGIFIEHLSIAASAYGKRITISKIYDYSHKQTGLIPFAELVIENLLGNESIVPETIMKRRTSRGEYFPKSITSKTFRKIKNEADNAGHSFKCSNNLQLVEFLKEVNQEALFHDLADDAMRNELDSLFRYSEAEALKSQDGLSAKCMGFNGSLLKNVFRNHKKWTQGLRAKILGKTYSDSLDGTQSIGWLQGEFSTTEDYIKAGRLLARIWLRITEDGAYIHPFGSLITNQTAYQKIYKKLYPSEDAGHFWMIFRVGFSKRPARSLRLDLSEIILNH